MLALDTNNQKTHKDMDTKYLTYKLVLNAEFNLLDKQYVPYELIAGQSQSADFSQYSQSGRNVSAHISYQF